MASKKTTYECGICADDYMEKSVLVCPKCETPTCKSCSKEWLESDEHEPRCANCHTPWSRRLLCEILGRSYVSGPLKKHMSKIWVGRVKATNSRYTEEAVELKKDMEYNKEIAKLDDKLSEIRKKVKVIRKNIKLLLSTHKKHPEIKLEQARRLRYYDQLAQIREEIKILQNKRNRAYYMLHHPAGVVGAIHGIVGGGASKPIKKSTVSYNRPCPEDRCNGYMSQIGHNWLCAICETKICIKCDGVVEKNGKPFLDEEGEKIKHNCKKEDIENVKAMMKETRPCPKCHTRIYKLNGCDQMYCVECEKRGDITAFSWTTGEIETGMIHNPHYMEYLRKKRQQNGGGAIREVGDNYCGGLPQYGLFAQRVNNSHVGSIITENLRQIAEFEQYEVRPLRQELRRTDIHRDNQIKYVAGLTNEQNFASSICSKEKKRQLQQEVLDVYEVILMVLTERFNQIYNDPSGLNMGMYMSFVPSFMAEENKCLAELSYIYGQIVKTIHYDSITQMFIRKWSIKTNTKKQLEFYKKHGEDNYSHYVYNKNKNEIRVVKRTTGNVAKQLKPVEKKIKRIIAISEARKHEIRHEIRIS